MYMGHCRVLCTKLLVCERQCMPVSLSMRFNNGAVNRLKHI
jgi:hypothetical protein